MITLPAGESGYFSRPTSYLDFHLFDENEHLLPDVRTLLNDLLMAYLAIKYNGAESWTMAWLAGSGISYQWSADRGDGDLDVLFGIDYNKFVTDNPEFSYMSRSEIANAIDNDLKKVLWKQTAMIPINGQNYEVTFFLNEYVEDKPDSILAINPYTAYCLTTDEWIVRPPKVAKNPMETFPEEYRRAAEEDVKAASALLQRYKALQTDAQMLHPTSPQAVNNKRSKSLVEAEARNLFDSIHVGRKAAFSPDGHGYFDYNNYRWQYAKLTGVINALNLITGE
jgi:hypothetical protein